jgi:hypothetical protein
MKSPNHPRLELDVEENMVNIARRKLLALTATAAPLLLFAIGSPARAAETAACFDLDAMPATQKSMRRSLGFKIESPDPQKHCGTCTFFTAAAGDCGKCALLNGGAVAAVNVCDSWAAKS